MNSEPIVYLRGSFLPASQAHVSIYDFGVVMGATVTDLLAHFKKWRAGFTFKYAMADEGSS